MREESRNLSVREEFASDRLVIFVFFLSGALLCAFGRILVPETVTPRLFLSVSLAAVCFFSASILGAVFLPVCALLYGIFAEHLAWGWFSGWNSGGGLDLRSAFCGAVLVPIFFLASVHGLSVSHAMLSSLRKGGPTIRMTVQKELFLVAFFAIVGFAFTFCFY